MGADVIRATAAQLAETRRPRRSRQAQLIATALAEADVFLSAQELHARLRNTGSSVGLSTVYRCLHDLATTGAIHVVTSETGEALYRHVSRDGDNHYQHRHGHFLVCRSCGAAVEVVSPTVERWVAATGRDNDYEQLTHRVEIFGICRACREARRETRSTVQPAARAS